MATGKNTNALQKPLTPSAELAAVVGSAQLSRGETVSKIWDYIKKNNLQNPANKREILADAKLKPIFGGKDKVSMFEMTKHLAAHLQSDARGACVRRLPSVKNGDPAGRSPCGVSSLPAGSLHIWDSCIHKGRPSPLPLRRLFSRTSS